MIRQDHVTDPRNLGTSRLPATDPPGIRQGARPGYPRSNRFWNTNVSTKLRDTARKAISSPDFKQLKTLLLRYGPRVFENVWVGNRRRSQLQIPKVSFSERVKASISKLRA